MPELLANDPVTIAQKRGGVIRERLHDLDVAAVARGDLSQSLGVAGQMDHPRLTELIRPRFAAP